MKLHRNFSQRIRPKYLICALLVAALSLSASYRVASYSDYYGGSEYLSCTDFKFIFARGSGAEVGSERDFAPFKQAVDEVFGNSAYSYSFYELGSRPDGWNGFSYPAPGIGISTVDRFVTSIGALVSGGEFNEYGDSVENGAIEALYYTFALQAACPNTKIVYAGYSQGAQVISRALQQSGPTDFFAALTFGDPKLYLPEGKLNLLTMSTQACHGEGYSDYRAYVPDCYAHEGILGGYVPYQRTASHSGKLKAYCQFHDVICSSAIDLDNIVYGHATYAEQGTYKRAIQDVYNMVEPSTYVRPAQNVAILFDVTGSMGPLLSHFKSEAIAVARRTMDKGGKVALYAYGDLEEMDTIELCNFETCNAENIESNISDLTVSGGGDTPESLLSASYKLMRRLNWDIGANKSLVVLTDADYHNPDRDGITLDEVVALSKSIDPVNIYILTNKGYVDSYEELAALTDGGVYVSNIDSALEDIETEFLSRDPGEIYTSTDLAEPTISSINNLTLEIVSESSIKIAFDTDASISILTINDMPLGYTTERAVEITDLDLLSDIKICVSPVSSTGYRGEAGCVTNNNLTSNASGAENNVFSMFPKAPNTGSFHE